MAFFDTFKSFLSSKKPLISPSKSTLPVYGAPKESPAPTPTNFTPANQQNFTPAPTVSYRDQFLSAQPTPTTPKTPVKTVTKTIPAAPTTQATINSSTTPPAPTTPPKLEANDFKSYYEKISGIPNLEQAETSVKASREAETKAFNESIAARQNLMEESQKLFDSVFNAPEIKASREQRSRAFSQLRQLDAQETQELEKFRADSQAKGTPSWAYRRQQEIISSGFNAQRAGYATEYAIANDNLQEATKYAERAYGHGLSILQSKIGLIDAALSRATTLSEREKKDYETILERAKGVYETRKAEQKEATATYLSLLEKGIKGLTPDMSIEQMTKVAGPEIVRQAQEERALSLGKTRAEIGAANALASQRIAETKKTLAETGQLANLSTGRTDELLGNLGLVNDILKNSGAISGPIQTGIIPFTAGSETANKYAQLQGLLALENRQKLKGSGAISDFEFRVLGEASSALGRNLSEEAFERELKKIKGVFTTSAGLQATVRLTDPASGESKLIQTNRAGINSAIADGLNVEYQ